MICDTPLKGVVMDGPTHTTLGSLKNKKNKKCGFFSHPPPPPPHLKQKTPKTPFFPKSVDCALTPPCEKKSTFYFLKASLIYKYIDIPPPKKNVLDHLGHWKMSENLRASWVQHHFFSLASLRLPSIYFEK